MPMWSDMVHGGGMRSSITNRLNAMPEEPAKNSDIAEISAGDAYGNGAQNERYPAALNMPPA
jgi:hypothetical protein